MAYLTAALVSFLNAVLPKDADPLPEGRTDRIERDLTGLSDIDAVWYYEMRKWRGRD